MKKHSIKIGYCLSKIALVTCVVTGYPVLGIACLLASGIFYAYM